MKQYVCFGVGCFHFGIKEKYRHEITGDQYLQYLKEDLKNITNIDNVNIECDDEFKSEIFSIERSEKNIDVPSFLPRPLVCDITFNVYIPKRIQDEIRPRIFKNVSPPNLYTEKFKVIIKYTYHYPVTLIIPLSPSNECHASESVIIIREFFEQQYKEKKNLHTKFEYMGPSPFHANFYIKTYQDLLDTVEHNFPLNGRYTCRTEKKWGTIEYHFIMIQNYMQMHMMLFLIYLKRYLMSSVFIISYSISKYLESISGDKYKIGLIN